MDPESSVGWWGGGVLTRVYFIAFHRGLYETPSRSVQLLPEGVRRKTIATSDFPGRGGLDPPPPPSEYVHAQVTIMISVMSSSMKGVRTTCLFAASSEYIHTILSSGISTLFPL